MARKAGRKAAKKGEYRINRFPICEIVYYGIAKRLGYSEEEAKALGHATAIFYALAKFGYLKRGKKGEKGEGSRRKVQPTLKIRFLDRTFNGIEINGKKYPVMGDSIVTERDFDKSLRSKLNEEEIKAILEYAVEYVNSYPEQALRRPFEIYKRVRDEWRTHEFWEKLMKERVKKVA